MDKTAECLQFRQGRKSFLQVVLDRLHIMVGDFLDVLDTLGVIDVEPAADIIDEGQCVFAQRGKLGHGLVPGQCLEPLEFNNDPVTDQSVFAEIVTQLTGLLGIPAIHCGDRSQGGELFHHVCAFAFAGRLGSICDDIK